ncbi:MAG TPA: LAGLIDADG family homing endonuclease [Tissierellaceae bacterium]|nr:LAGLIDADG family homing endonuclease [Tissierellaceae bacterium]
MKAIYKEFYWKSFLTTRRRSTQFKSNFKTIIWSCYKREFRERLVELGMSKENKSITADIPNCKYNIPAFWRGFLDGDGSIGMTRNNEPFISVTIRSGKLAKKYLEMLRERFNIIKILNPNKRDNVNNIVVKNEDAISLGSYIYRDSGIHLERKYKKFKEIKK